LRGFQDTIVSGKDPHGIVLFPPVAGNILVFV